MIIVNEADPILKGHLPAGRKYLGFTTGIPEQDEYGIRERQGNLWLARGSAYLMPVSELRINGFHNVANALAALALGNAAGLSLPAMLQALKAFKGLPHRMEWVAEKNGVTWYNDSKGTNVGATMAALRGIDSKVVLIAGGLGKGADFSHLREVVADKARAVVLIGRDAALIARALGDIVPVVYATDMPDAVRHAGQNTQQGDAVLLSPACASFDMFKNYEDRGAMFIKSVKRLLV